MKLIDFKTMLNNMDAASILAIKLMTLKQIKNAKSTKD